LGNSELSRNSRWRDPRFESGAHSIQFPLRQRNGDCFHFSFARIFIRDAKLLTVSLLLSEHSCKQSTEFQISKLFGV
jgi:hypothetical protein